MHWMCHIGNMKLMIFSFLTGSPIIFLTYVSMEINIDAIYFNDCANIMISDDTSDGLISTAIYDGNSMDCDEDTAVGLIADIGFGDSMDCADLSILDDVTYVLIATDIDSTGFSDTNVSDYSVDRFIMYMC